MLCLFKTISPDSHQPILSASVLDQLIHNDRKLPPEVGLAENWAEVLSLQLAAFLMTVCHVVVVVQDWFTDINLYRCGMIYLYFFYYIFLEYVR